MVGSHCDGRWLSVCTPLRLAGPLPRARWVRATHPLSRSACGQALPAGMIAKNVETLKNMNSNTAKFAKWYVRILEPKVISYTVASRGETVHAHKF